jgi:hypothetical protein
MPTGSGATKRSAGCERSASTRSSGWCVTAADRKGRTCSIRTPPQRFAEYAAAFADRYPWRTLDLLIDGAARLDPDGIVGCDAADLRMPARRPRYSALGTERGEPLPALEESLSRYVRERISFGTAA